jgi:hypothetical protein
VVPEQRHPGLFDNRQVLTPVINDVDRDLGYLLRPGTTSSESTAEIGKHLAGLDRQITATDEIALYIFGFLA